jgi:hypothetical protein
MDMDADSDDHLIRYLVGDLADDEAERLDERSITDDAFAFRLRLLENDLIDRYARGKPFDAMLERFDGMYRTSPHLRERVRFAQALSVLTVAKAKPGLPSAPIASASHRAGWWELAAAAVFVIVAVGYAGMRNVRLLDELRQMDARSAAVQRQNAELQQELDRMRVSPGVARPPVPATFLRAPRRSLGNDTTTIAIPRGTEQMTLRLQVESDAYAVFWASLRDPATTRTVWRSGDLPVEIGGSDRLVSVTIPVGSLLAQRYSVDLTGVAAGGSNELVGHYTIRVVLE